MDAATTAANSKLSPNFVRDRYDHSSAMPIIETSEAGTAELFAKARAQSQRLQQTSLAERLAAIRKVRDAIFAQQEWIVERVMAETGKCRTDALVSEVLGVLDYMDWLLAKAPKILGDEKVATPIALLGKKSRIYYEALGTVLIISPWNYPFHISMTTIVAALAAGNSVVFKPSEVTPLQGVIESLMQASPLLQDAVQVAYGSGVTAQRLIDQRPAKIFFTGSARTGKKILAQAAPHLIPVDLELGGKDAMIVFDDVNIERTVAGCLWGGFTNAGQSCTSVERVLVQRGIYDAFVETLTREAARLVVNAGDHGDADMGGITADFQYEIIAKQVQDAIDAGASLLCGGQGLGDGQNFYLPTILADVPVDQPVWQDETFGPVLVVSVFDHEEDAIALANAGPYGLSASVWSKDLVRADRVARALDVGAVSVNNVMLTEGNPNLPFGGAKQSGFGRVKGAEGLRGMARSKAVIIDKQSAKIEANWYPYTQAKYQLFRQFIGALFGKGWQRWIRFAVSGTRLESEAQKPRQ